MKDQPSKPGKPTAKSPAPGFVKKPSRKKTAGKKPAVKKQAKPKKKAAANLVPARNRGNPPFAATAQQREKCRTLSKTFPVHAEHNIATLLGLSLSTLKRHFQDDLNMGRAEMLAAVGAQMINRALDLNTKNAKGDIDAQKFILARLGGWTTKVELGGEGGGPIATIDLSGMSPQALREYGRQAAMLRGLNPDEAVGPAIND